MSTVNLSSTGDVPLVLPSIATERLLTAADLAALPSVLPSGEVRYELHRGKLIVISLPGHRHGSVQARLAAAFVVQGEERGFGNTYTETGVLLAKNPDSVCGPDLAFVGKAKNPIRETPEGYLETIPDIVVEIRSKNDTLAELERKANDFLEAGVYVVWIVDDTSRTVKVLEANTSPRTFGYTDELPEPPAIPGLRLTVKKILGLASE